MNRDINIKKIRPSLLIGETDKKPIELYQNVTLRPILKLQHEFTLSLLENHKNFKSNSLNFSTRQEYESYITKFIQSNIDFKNQIIGATIGLCTKEELNFYLEHRKELNKRIITMQSQRFVDTEFKM